MGYPMTFKRVVNRNALQDGDYTTPPVRHSKRVVMYGSHTSDVSEDEAKLARYDHLAKRIEEYEKAFQMLAGDLRRLEQDAVDEKGICTYIAHRVGLASDDVAMVLKEFVEF
jgi:hypothetical protein